MMDHRSRSSSTSRSGRASFRSGRIRTSAKVLSSSSHKPPPNDLTVQVAVQPTSGRLPEATYAAVREDLKGQVQYKTMVHFDAQENWRVRISLQSAQGNGETIAFVEPTPEGLGRWDLLIYLLPFLAIGFIWLRAFLSKRKKRFQLGRPSVAAPALKLRRLGRPS